MKPPTWIGVHVVDADRLIQRQQNVADTFDVSAGNSPPIVILEQPPESTTSEGNDRHREGIQSVARTSDCLVPM
jgi:hypothetical protein